MFKGKNSNIKAIELIKVIPANLKSIFIEANYIKNSIYSDVVFDLFQLVREHLTKDWSKSIESGLKEGKLI